MKPQTQKQDREQPLDDPRLQAWPKVFQSGKEIKIRFRTLPPFRLFLLYEFVVAPLRGLWKLAAFAYVVAFALRRFEVYDAFSRFGIPLIGSLVALVLIATLWIAERMRVYPASRLILGRNIGIQINKDEVIVRAGFASRKFSLKTHHVSFAQHHIAGARTDIYQNASFLCIIIDDIKRIPLVEIFHSINMEDVITNANVALRLSVELQNGKTAAQPQSMVEDGDMLM